jgi:retron-type reverse transcriptase
MKFEINFMEKITELCNNVNNRTYKIGKSITFLITQPKLREVFAASFDDRVIHHIIFDRVNPLFEKVFITDSYSCREGKGTLYGVSRLSEKIQTLSNNYTEDAWIGKFDIKGFFMSISKSKLWKMLEDFILTNYHEADRDTLLYLTEKTVLHAPQKYCIRKTPKWRWKALPKDKSLFTCNPDCGLPIGNLTSQCFANFYLNEFDHFMENLFSGYYGRYVDDFYVVAKTKKEITDRINDIKNFLWNKLGLKLHDKKLYIQRYDRGVKFIGTVVKKDRKYTGNLTRGNIVKTIHHFNVVYATYETAEKFCCVINSYFGFMKYTNSRRLKKKLIKSIDNKWRGILYFPPLETKPFYFGIIILLGE